MAGDNSAAQFGPGVPAEPDSKAMVGGFTDAAINPSGLARKESGPDAVGLGRG